MKIHNNTYIHKCPRSLIIFKINVKTFYKISIIICNKHFKHYRKFVNNSLLSSYKLYHSLTNFKAIYNLTISTRFLKQQFQTMLHLYFNKQNIQLKIKLSLKFLKFKKEEGEEGNKKKLKTQIIQEKREDLPLLSVFLWCKYQSTKQWE